MEVSKDKRGDDRDWRERGGEGVESGRRRRERGDGQIMEATVRVSLID